MNSFKYPILVQAIKKLIKSYNGKIYFNHIIGWAKWAVHISKKSICIQLPLNQATVQNASYCVKIFNHERKEKSPNIVPIIFSTNSSHHHLRSHKKKSKKKKKIKITTKLLNVKFTAFIEHVISQCAKKIIFSSSMLQFNLLLFFCCSHFYIKVV